MYAMLILGLLIVVSLVGMVFFIVADIKEGMGVCIGVALFFIILLAISLGNGISIKKQNINIQKKEYIEYALENNPSLYVFEQAQDYNREIEAGNNLWCRFNIEDRSEYKIDIDKYIRRNNNEKIFNIPIVRNVTRKNICIV